MPSGVLMGAHDDNGFMDQRTDVDPEFEERETDISCKTNETNHYKFSGYKFPVHITHFFGAFRLHRRDYQQCFDSFQDTARLPHYYDVDGQNCLVLDEVYGCLECPVLSHPKATLEDTCTPAGGLLVGDIELVPENYEEAAQLALPKPADRYCPLRGYYVESMGGSTCLRCDKACTSCWGPTDRHCYECRHYGWLDLKAKQARCELNMAFWLPGRDEDGRRPHKASDRDTITPRDQWMRKVDMGKYRGTPDVFYSLFFRNITQWKEYWDEKESSGQLSIVDIYKPFCASPDCLKGCRPAHEDELLIWHVVTFNRRYYGLPTKKSEIMLLCHLIFYVTVQFASSIVALLFSGPDNAALIPWNKEDKIRAEIRAQTAALYAAKLRQQSQDSLTKSHDGVMAVAQRFSAERTSEHRNPLMTRRVIVRRKLRLKARVPVPTVPRHNSLDQTAVSTTNDSASTSKDQHANNKSPADSLAKRSPKSAKQRTHDSKLPAATQAASSRVKDSRPSLDRRPTT
ncbi:unnamed protein product, partial [Mesorhabditis spiculigera]